MSLFSQDGNKIIARFESGTFATPSGTSGLWLGLVESHEVTENTNVFQLRYTGTATRDVNMFVDGPRDYEGTITLKPQDFMTLGYALGSIVDTSGTSVSTHTYTATNNDTRWAYTSGLYNPFASMTIVEETKGIADGQHQVRQYKGATANSWTFTASEGEVCTIEYGYLAKEMSLGSKTTDIVPIRDQQTARPFVWSDVKLHFVSGTILEESKEISLSINNNLEAKHYMNGSRDVAALVPLNREYELSVTLDASSQRIPTLSTYWDTGSTFNAILDVTAITGSKSCIITMSGCKITEFTRPVANEGVNEYSLTVIPQTISAIDYNQRNYFNPW